MDIGFGVEQEMLCDTARKFLDATCTPNSCMAASA
jgi:hypothetical protein